MRNIMVILFSVLLTQPTFAVLKKCVDNEGNIHYYDSILPLECQGKATIEMNKQGIVIQRSDAVESPLSIEDAAADQAEMQRLAEEKKRDAVLLNIYTSVEEIELARERNLHPITLTIIGVQKRLEIAQNRLNNLQKQAREAEQAGSPILASIRQDIIPAQKEVASLKKELQDNLTRLESIQAKFDADKKRFLVLVESKSN